MRNLARFLALAMGMFAYPAAAQAPVPHAIGVPQPNAFALVVAIEGYRDLPAAPGAHIDGGRYLSMASKTLGIPAEHIRSAINERATRTDIELQLEWLRSNVTSNARIYFFYSGHGTPDPSTGASYLVPYDADASAPKKSGIRLDDVLSALNQTKAKEILVFLDSGFSGQGARSLLAPGTRPLVTIKAVGKPAKVALFSASQASEIAGPAPANQGGLFSHYLFEALGQGNADIDGDGQITTGELHRWIAPRVSRAARLDGRDQTPEFNAGRSIASPDGLPVLWGLSRSAKTPAPLPPIGPATTQASVSGVALGDKDAPLPAYSALAVPSSAVTQPPPQASFAPGQAPHAELGLVPGDPDSLIAVDWGSPTTSPQPPAGPPATFSQSSPSPTSPYPAVAQPPPQAFFPAPTQKPAPSGSQTTNQAAPPTAPPDPGYHKHDGFYLQMAGGGGTTNFSVAGESISKGSGYFGFSLGWSLSESWILSVRMDGNFFSGEYSDVNLCSYAIGPTYYFVPSNWYLSATAGAFRAKEEDRYGDMDSSWGFAFGAAAGKEWWVSSNWGLGAALRVDVGRITEASESLTTTSVSLLMSATYN